MVDRFINWAIPVKRYRCSSSTCPWQGNRLTSWGDKRLRVILALRLTVVVVILGLALGLLSVNVTESIVLEPVDVADE
jgi:hypothetical protein